MLVLTAGLLVTTASAASAHANAVQGVASCQSDTGTWAITWTITNDYALTETATSRLGTAQIAKQGSATQTETVSTAGTHTLTVDGKWSDGVRQTAKGTVVINGTCSQDNDTVKKIEFCHATGSTTNPYVLINTSVSAFYNADTSTTPETSGRRFPT